MKQAVANYTKYISNIYIAVYERKLSQGKEELKQHVIFLIGTLWIRGNYTVTQILELLKNIHLQWSIGSVFVFVSVRWRLVNKMKAEVRWRWNRRDSLSSKAHLIQTCNGSYNRDTYCNQQLDQLSFHWSESLIRDCSIHVWNHVPKTHSWIRF